MKTASKGVISAATLLSGLCHAETADIGRALSSDFLSKLILARASSEQIAVIHEQVGSAMLIDAKGTETTLTYLRGTTFLWTQINDQAPKAFDQGKPIHLEIARWTMGEQSCHGLDRDVAAFLARVEEAVADFNASSTDGKESWLDAPTVHIQMAAKDGWLSITPNGSANSPLQQATLKVHSIVSGCANYLQPSIEKHDF